MTTETDLGRPGPNILVMIRSYWRLIAFLGVGLALIGFLYGSSRPSEYRSSASVVVDDPRSSTLFGSENSSRPERYVETQIGIISSPSVAEKASELLAAEDPPVELTPADILAGQTVSSQVDSDLIAVSFVSKTPEIAEAAANAIVTSYLEVRRSEAVAGFATALNQLDESIAQSQSDLKAVSEEIQTLQESRPFLTELQQQYEQILERLVALPPPGTTGADGTNPDALAAIAEEVAVIENELNAIEAVSRIESQSPELAALLEEQNLALSRLSTLIERRNQVAVDAELAGGGFVFQSEANAATRVNPSATVFGLVAGVLGGLIGVAVAYTMSMSRRRVEAAEEPEWVLRSPLLGAIPEFTGEIDTWIPVENAVHSKPAEAFRFVMAAIESQLTRPDLPSHRFSDYGDRMVFVTAASPGDGTTTVVANIAVAGARSGRRVLLVDADFASQRLSELLLPDEAEGPGLADVVLGTRQIEDALKPVPVSAGGELHLLSRGSDVLGSLDVFGSSETLEVFSRVREEYDLILIDAPPIQQVGYATTLARLADRVLLVVRHRALITSLEDLRRRLSLIRARDLGYVYNRIPSAGETRRSSRSVTDRASTSDPDIETLESIGADT